jgi:hypothetical protein
MEQRADLWAGFRTMMATMLVPDGIRIRRIDDRTAERSAEPRPSGASQAGINAPRSARVIVPFSIEFD